MFSYIRPGGVPSTLVPLLLLTGMRADEALSRTWAQADLKDKTLTVRRAKTSNATDGKAGSCLGSQPTAENRREMVSAVGIEPTTY
jgi:integrase